MSSEAETLSAKALATVEARNIMEVGGVQYRVKNQVTRTVLRQVEKEPFFVTFENAAFQSQPLPNPKGGRPMQPPMVCHVYNLATKQRQLLIMNTVLLGNLIQAYPADGYVGKSFAIRGETPAKGSSEEKSYRVYDILEIDPIEPSLETTTIVATTEDAPVNKNGEPLHHKAKGK
jgi:hypothetical protein